MRGIKRPIEPRFLAEKRKKWRDAFEKKRARNPKARPPSGQYGHERIRDALAVMSAHKCFYCERSLKDCRSEVDHYIEVSERPDLAFEWSNLYLACFECNRKKRTNTELPVTDCVDPCDGACDPAEHLAFEDEYIRARDQSPRGGATIQKYHLHRPDLDHRRLKELDRLRKVLVRIQGAMIRERRQSMRPDELEILRSFADPERPFSLMFRVLLARHPLPGPTIRP